MRSLVYTIALSGCAPFFESTRAFFIKLNNGRYGLTVPGHEAENIRRLQR